MGLCMATSIKMSCSKTFNDGNVCRRAVLYSICEANLKENTQHFYNRLGGATKRGRAKGGC